MWVVGRISHTSHALFTANHQYAAGSIAAVIQLQAIVTMEVLDFATDELVVKVCSIELWSYLDLC
eukprot:9482560-Ditylum_brightwellii.AAC.1